MRRFFVLVLMLFVMAPRVFAQALPLPVSPMQNAVSGAMQEKMIARGFAANDPRFGATLAKSSTALAGVAGTATAVTVGTVTAPGWASVALAIGLGAVITYAVQLGLDALTNWLFRSDGKIDESGQPLAVPTSTTMTVGGEYWFVSFHSAGVDIDLAGGDGEALARQGYAEYLAQTNQQPRSPSCTKTSQNLVSCGIITAQRKTSGAPGACPAGYLLKSGSCSPYSFLAPPAVPEKTAQALQQAINDLPATDKSKALNPVIVAALADQAWVRAAAQPDYDGLPYVASDPVTAQDAARWQQLNPESWPTVQDFVIPQPAPTGGTSSSPYVLPNTSNPVSSYDPATSQGTNPAASNPLANLGPDPAIGSPTLEATPTAQSILAPVLGLLPDFRAFVAPSQSGSCPKPSMDLWGKHLVLDGHCALLDENAAVIQAIMAAVWMLLAVFIVLSA